MLVVLRFFNASHYHISMDFWYICNDMIKIENTTETKRLKGIIFHEDELVGVIDNVISFLDMRCKIKAEGSDKYRMEVEVPMTNGDRRTYSYRFDKDGKMSPMSYPNVRLWDDELNDKLLFLSNFKTTF